MGTVAGSSGRREDASAEETACAEGAKFTKGLAGTPTIYDVARVAGVATSTVSRALSNPAG